MKKTLVSLVALLAVLLLATLAFAACKDAETPATTYTVTFKDGDTVVKTATVESGKTVAAADIPANPAAKEGYTFDGWFNGETAFAADTAITGDVTFTAKWSAAKVTVTFKDGQTELKKNTVDWGTALAAADIPANPTKAGNNFLGWYNGETAFAADTQYKADTVFTAKWEVATYTVTFKSDDVPVATPSATYGFALADTDLPTNPEKGGYRFDGWFNGDTPFDETAPITADVTYTAKWTKNAFIITYVNGETATEKYVDYVTEGDAVLGTAIETAPEGDTFLGWYNAATKAEATTVVTADMTFKAIFKNPEAYTGAWISMETGKEAMLYFDGTTANFTYYTGYSGMSDGEYDAATGAWIQDDGYWRADTWTLLALDGVMQISHYYWDDYEEMNVTDVWVLPAAATVGYEGEYRKGGSSSDTMEIGIGGILYDTYDDFAVLLKDAEGDGYTLYSKYNADDELEAAPCTIAADGTIVFANDVENTTYRGIWVKGATSYKSFYESNAKDYLYMFVVNETAVYVVKADDCYYYATVDKALELNNIVNVTYNGTTVEMQITGSSNMRYAGEEKGVYFHYINGIANIELNGFNVGKINGVEMAYTYFPATHNVVFANGAGYTLDLNAGKYIVATPVAGIPVGAVYTSQSSSSQVFTFSGYGDVTYNYYSYTYYGSYTIENDGTTSTLTISDCYSYNCDGTWTMEDGGNVLVKGSAILLKQGYVPEDHKAEMDGMWAFNGAILIIDSASNSVTLDGERASSVKYNYNGTILTFSVEYAACAADAGIAYYDTREFTVTLNGSDLSVTHMCNTGMDEYDEYPAYAPVEETFTVYVPPVEDTVFKGTWTQEGGSNTLVFDGFKVSYNGGTAVDYTPNGNTVAFIVSGYVEITCTIRPDGKMDVDFDDGEYTLEWVFEKEAAQLDAFAGTWTNQYDVTIVFQGDGNMTYDGNHCTYEVNGNTVEFYYNYCDYIGTLSGDELTLNDGEYDLPVFVKQ